MPRALNLVFWFKVKPSEETSFSPCKASFGWGKRSERLQGTDMALGLPSWGKLSLRACVWSTLAGSGSYSRDGELWKPICSLALAQGSYYRKAPESSVFWRLVVGEASWPSIILGFLFRQAPAVEKLNQRIRFRKPYPPVPGPDLFKGSCSDVKMK